MKSYTYDLDTWSDLHKDVYGFRPGRAYYDWRNGATEDELQKEWDFLLRALIDKIAEEKRCQEESIVRFETLLNELIELGAADKKTAVRWIMEAESIDDVHGLCFDFNLPLAYAESIMK